MNVISVPSTIQMRRRRLLGLIAAIAVAAAGITYGLASAFDTSTKSTQQSLSPRVALLQSLPAKSREYVQSIMALTPKQLAAGAAGFTSGRTISPDDRAISRATSANASGAVTVSPDDRSFSRATGTAPLNLAPDDRAFFRGSSSRSSVHTLAQVQQAKMYAQAWQFFAKSGTPENTQRW
jgi:hypothetical protein